MALVNYCTATDVTRLLGSSGANLRSDDDVNAVQDCIDEASAEIDFYCRLAYDQTVLQASAWVTKRCRLIAAYYLATRRNNPAAKSLKERYDKTVKDLERIQAGSLTIADAPQRKEAVPVLSNLRVAQQPLNRVVVEPSRSTGTPEGYQQQTEYIDPGTYIGPDWNI